MRRSNPETHQKDSIEMPVIPSTLKRLLLRFAVVAASLTANPAEAHQKAEESKTRLETVLPRVPKVAASKAVDTKGSYWLPSGIGIEPTFIEQDEYGNHRFNIWALIAPLQVDLTREIHENSKFSAYVPYEYSRLFADDPRSDQPLHPADHEKIVHYVEQKLRHSLADALYALDMSKRVHAYHESSRKGSHRESVPLRNKEIKNVQIIGITSPEGPEQKGPSTLASKNIDSENVELGRARGIAGREYSRDAFGKLSLPVGTIDAANVQSKEIQFSDHELRNLADLAHNYQGIDQYDRIYQLVCDYNQGNISDPHMLKELDRILAEKRGFIIKFDYVGDRSETVIIPLPLLLLIARRRIKDQKPPTEKDPEPTKEQEKVKSMRKIMEKPMSDRVPDKVKKTTLPPEHSREYEQMEEIQFFEEIYYPFINNIPCEIKELEIRSLLVYAENLSLSCATKEAELILTDRILDLWQRIDAIRRKEVGIVGKVAIALNYQEKERIIRHARLEARMILTLVNERKEKKNKVSYVDVITSRAKILTNRMAMHD